MLVFMKEFLNTIAAADKILQSREIGFHEAIPVIRYVVQIVIKLRTEDKFDRILNSAKEMLLGEDIKIQVRPSRNKNRPTKLERFCCNRSNRREEC